MFPVKPFTLLFILGKAPVSLRATVLLVGCTKTEYWVPEHPLGGECELIEGIEKYESGVGKDRLLPPLLPRLRNRSFDGRCFPIAKRLTNDALILHPLKHKSQCGWGRELCGGVPHPPGGVISVCERRWGREGSVFQGEPCSHGSRVTRAREHP
ncbi:hypothetical protein CEXT_384671 [Caerostris extrusa]|uniref:Secreted protein n=1 Tax=Caerostris extrusa TaxID=172846 RepID=A0AAV4RRF6_CAEEX|nr:hypothetical protein CEXT_384671 [Caerostris extrusa]